MTLRVGHRTKLPPDFVSVRIPFFPELFRCRATGLVETDELVGCGPVTRTDGHCAADYSSAGELEIDAINRLTLTNDNVKPGRSCPVLVVDVNGVGLARADRQLVSSIRGCARAVLAIFDSLAAAVGRTSMPEAGDPSGRKTRPRIVSFRVILAMTGPV